jgi:hypothetical protein
MLAVFVAEVCAGDMRKVWELRFSDLAEGKIGNTAVPVSAVSFSPDGRRVAAIVLGEQEGRQIPSFLVIVDLTSPRTGSKVLRVPGPASSDDLSLAMSWSSAGDWVAVPTVIQTGTGAGCVLSHTIRSVFYDDARIADCQPGFPKSSVELFDTKCQQVGAWEIDGKWELSDASVERHLIALTRMVSHERTELAVADPVGKRVVKRWPGGLPLFADRGRAVCGLDGTGMQGVARCWDVDSGEEIARTNGGNMHWPMRTAIIMPSARFCPNTAGKSTLRDGKPT